MTEDWPAETPERGRGAPGGIEKDWPSEDIASVCGLWYGEIVRFGVDAREERDFWRPGGAHGRHLGPVLQKKLSSRI